MQEFEQRELDLEVPRPRGGRLRRGIYLLPGSLTVLNLLCGYYSVLASLMGGVANFDHAAIAIGVAVVFDSLDGRMARRFGTTTEFGKQFDSLADVISFGIAPAVLAYSWGAKNLQGASPEMAQQIAQIGWVVCLYFVICCAWRLARFNVQGMAPASPRHFVGLPTPASAGTIAAFVHYVKNPIADWRWALAWLVLPTVLATLMISRVRYHAFKDLPWTRRQPSLTYVLLGILAAAIWMYSEKVLLGIGTVYVSTGLILHVIRFARRHLSSRAAKVQ
jgi:CDP-diacylglycerol---serine O-phosphatidyltransferase